MSLNRRTFLVGTITAIAANPVSTFAQTVTATPNPINSPIRPEPKRGPKQESDLVFAFVRAGHDDLPKVQSMLSQDPKLVVAGWDWGGGDWETALGGASHLGNREIARYLISRGARVDIFCAAMLGEREVVASLVKANAWTPTTTGPHGYTLLYHVAISGDVMMAELLKRQLAPDARDFNQALAAAVRGGHLEMTQWLFQNAQINPNLPDALGRLPLSLAMTKGYTDVAEILRRNGARESMENPQ